MRKTYLIATSIIVGLLINKIGYKISGYKASSKTYIFAILMSLIGTLASLYEAESIYYLGRELIFIYWFILLSVIDIHIQVIENYLIFLPSLIFLLVDSLVLKGMNIVILNFIRGIIMFTIMYFIYFLSRKRLGGADVKVFFIIAYMYGILGSLNILFLASLLGLIYYLYTYIRFKEITSLVPFIPFITGGIILNTYIKFIYI